MKKLPKAAIITGTLLGLSLFLLYFAASLVFRLNSDIQHRFDGNRWSLPAVVYARPLELYPGRPLTAEIFEKELQLAGYRQEKKVEAAGGYHRLGSSFHVVTRDFIYPEGLEQSIGISLDIIDNQIARLVRSSNDTPLSFIRLDPAKIGSFHPLVHQDRIVLHPSEIPDLLRNTLIAVEDKGFYSHHGISLLGILRALLANIAAGKTVEGGSTLTQQLVKNLFLNRDRTLSRKLQEAIMAILLEYHYSKDEILTTYINEVFLGQDGARAIHGFGLASQFYFRKDLQDLSVGQIATLVGMVKGPSFYDPRRNPKNSRTRRDIVLHVLQEEAVVNQQTITLARNQPLKVLAPQNHGFNRFPAFLALVKRQLQKEYREEDLKGSGLIILTTLDPQIQWQVELQLMNSISLLEKGTSVKDIEGSVVVSGREDGEIQALAGGKKPLSAGFNRALDAYRPIGSLVKPAVYLTALAHGYTLASPLMDTAISLDYQGKRWQPKNFDNTVHGRVALYSALAMSYNLATVRLGMEIGLPKIVATLNSLGYPKTITPYPSLLLGAVSMSTFEVSQIYHTIASGGFYQPLRSIRAVMSVDNTLLTRYGLDVKQHFSPDLMFLVTHGLQRVMEEGTGKRYAPTANRSFAGKTGTSDDLRDSWFAGFSEDRLAVVWLGRDDNKTVNLTGSSGALMIWGKIMTSLGTKPLIQSVPSGIQWQRIDTNTLQRTHIFNPDKTLLPFLAVQGSHEQ